MKTPFNFWPFGIIAAFVLFFIGMASVIVIASTHRDSLVSANYYEQELKFQNQIDAAANGTKCGATIRLDRASGQIVASVPPEHLNQDFHGTLVLYRANAPEMDREFPLAPGINGVQALGVSGLAQGPWQVRASWTASGTNYFVEQKIAL